MSSRFLTRLTIASTVLLSLGFVTNALVAGACLRFSAPTTDRPRIVKDLPLASLEGISVAPHGDDFFVWGGVDPGFGYEATHVYADDRKTGHVFNNYAHGVSVEV